MLLVLSTIRLPVMALLYVVIFGIGSTAGMMIMTALVALPAVLTAHRFTRANAVLCGAAGVFSVVWGLFMVCEIGYRWMVIS